MDQSDITVSVIVPVFHNLEGATALLKDLRRQTFPREHTEVIVVDNGSNGDLTRLADVVNNVVVIREQKVGSYACRNTGIRNARGQILAFTDSDCRLDPSWLACGVAALRTLPGPGIVAGNVVVTTTLHPTAVELFEKATMFKQNTIVRDRHYVLTANLFAFKKLFDTVGYFNESLLSGGDFEWGNRVFRCGTPLLYKSDAVVLHPAMISLSSFLNRMSRIVDGLVTVEKNRQQAPLAFMRALLRDYAYNFSNLRIILTDSSLQGPVQRLKALGVWCALQCACVLYALQSFLRKQRLR